MDIEGPKVLRDETVVELVAVPPRWPYVGAALAFVLFPGVLELAAIGFVLWWMA